MANAEVAKLKEELKMALAQLGDAQQRAARAEGERDELRHTVAVLQQALTDARTAMAGLRLAEELGAARGRLDECLTRATTQPQPVVLPRVVGDGRG